MIGLRTGFGLPVLATLLCGCGSSSPPPIVSHVTVRTQAGVRYAAEVRISGRRTCMFQTYTVIAAHVKPFAQTMRSCGPSNGPARPILIQVAKPPTALILDRPSQGCAAVRIISARARRPVVADTTCSAGKPTLRITRLPLAARLTIVGIPGLTRLLLPDYPCSFICSRRLPTPR